MTPQQQVASNDAIDLPPKPFISRIVFVHSISFAGGIDSASSDPGPAAVARLGSGINIVPATMTPSGPRELVKGAAWDGFILTKDIPDRASRKVVRHMHFVDRGNVKEVALAVE